MFKKILNQLNLSYSCKQYGIPLWQCPQLLFLLMGILIIISIFAAYFIGNRYIEDPGGCFDSYAFGGHLDDNRFYNYAKL